MTPTISKPSPPHLFFGKVGHHRLLPKKMSFNYGLYYLLLPLSQEVHWSDFFAHNRFSALSFYDRDHGLGRDLSTGEQLQHWAQALLMQHQVKAADGEIWLMTMPRILGYVFNPVSFWFCCDREGHLRAVIAEVNNTFGERHVYLCIDKNHSVIEPQSIIQCQKNFHVSPFFKREGHYNFRFQFQSPERYEHDTKQEGSQKIAAWINYFNAEQHPQLVTSLVGHVQPLTRSGLRRAFWFYPLVTIKTIYLIHWQALKIIAKGIGYISRPKPLETDVTVPNSDQKPFH